MANKISLPKVNINVLPASQTQSALPQKVLFVGQKVTAGSAAAGVLQTSIGNANEENTLFGRTSMLAGMIRAAKVINGQTRFDAIALDDAGAAVAAAGKVTFAAGVSTESGTFTVTVGSDKNHKYSVAVASGDSITAIGDKLVALIAADSDAPFTSSNAIGDVTITAVNKGTVGNSISLKVEGVVAGVTHSVTAFTSGATDPSLTTLFDVIVGERYQTIVFPSEYGFTFITDQLDPLFNATNDVLDGVGVTSKTDTLANLKTAGNGENSKSLTILGNNIVSDTSYKGSALLELDHITASELGAVRSLRLTEDANISLYVIATNGARDSFGGSAIASLPYFNTPFFQLPIIPSDKGFTPTEVDELQTAGISVLGNNRNRNTTIAGEIMTTRKTDSAGNPEDTFKYLNNVDTAVTVREIFFNNLKSRFAQSRLTSGNVVPGRNMANKPVIESFLDGLYSLLSGDDFVLTQAGATALKFFKLNRTVSLDLVNGKATVTMQVPIVVQLREIIATIQIAFSTEG